MIRAAAVWLLILVLAIVNGAGREKWLIPRFGDVVGRGLSTLALCGLIFLTTWLTVGWMHPRTSGDALRIGALWLVLTLGFEFLVGHYGFGKPWAVLLEDYDLSKGRIWIAVLIMVLLAPFLTAHMKGLVGTTS